MIYISHLIPDEEMKFFVEKYGAGVESIDFSISDNLDQLSRSIEYYRKKMNDMGTDQLILHGPFLDVNPCAYDSLVREATMKRFAQCYEAGLALGAKKIVFHSGMNPYVYYKESWADHVSHVHVHDNCGDRDSHIGLGKGNLPWKEVLKLLPQDQGRTWTIECMKKEDVQACLESLYASDFCGV